ncbi:MAG: type II toxin-antitoxin system RelE/ParE family toxin [Methylovulum sp.]|nr:type II toxin-antitoxin system RelE/ParE family toxin [Methylovulum sp.]
MKAIIFLGNSKDDLKGFPDEARREAGFQLSTVQSGLEPSDWKPMPDIGSGVREIRVRIGGAFRVIYLANRPEGVYVLHCFQKKSQHTAKHDIALAQARFKQIG